MNKNKSKNKDSIKQSGQGSEFPLIDYAGNIINEVVELFKKTKSGNEFEFIFFSKRGRYLPQEKYNELLNYFVARSKQDSKVKLLEPSDILDITYQEDMENVFRCSVDTLDKINYYMKKLNMFRNHVTFRTLIDLSKNPKEQGLSVMKKEKKSDSTIDVDDLDFRARLSLETLPTKEEMEKLSKLDEKSMNKIKFRYKQRVSMYVYGNEKSDEYVRIDLTYTKMSDSYKKLNVSIPSYELEIEYGLNKKGSPSLECVKVMLKEAETLLKIVQQSNFIITKSKASKTIEFYKNLLSVELDKTTTSLEARQTVTLEIQHVTGELVNRYAVTDKADGERHFMIINENEVYLITTNLEVKSTGIKLSDKLSEYNGTILDGELIFIPEKNRHIFLVFDCLFHKSIDIRPTIKLMDRIAKADDVIEKCFIFGKQKGFKIGSKSYNLDKFDLNKKLINHTNELKELISTLNSDIEIEKQYPLIRRKYFIEATGGKDWEIFAYALTLWGSFTTNSSIKCPYYLDGLIFQPLEQSYVTTKKDNKLPDYKWKPPEKNSIDFYLEFEKDQNGKPLMVYDNSRDDLDHLRNKPYRIAKLYVGQQNKGTEAPVLFKEEEELYLAYLFLEDGEARDLDGNIIVDKTVVEAYYNNDPELLDKFKWVIIRTRHDKTESVLRFGRKYGNYSTVADKVWRSITNPVLMSDFEDLAKGNDSDKNIYAYDKKMEAMRSKIGHELIISAAKESAYFQQRTNLAKPMRGFMNFLKDEMIWTFCHPMYQDNRQLSVLDIACGKGQDIMKWFYARISTYVGVDIDREGLENATDGAKSRYRQLQKRPNFPKMTFLQADCSAELDVESQKNALNLRHLNDEELYKKFFSTEQSKRTLFDRINCQLAVHYFLKNEDTWSNFKKNINGYLRNGGYFMALTFDGRKIMELLGENEKYTQYYTDENGKSKMLFEIIRKYETPKTKDFVMGVGNAIDVYIAWFSLEGRYLTEYLVDSKFITEDLKNDCDLELVSTDNCQNQMLIHNQYLNHYAKFEDEPRTRKFLSDVASFYKSDSVNDGTKIWMKLFRYYVFRKKGNFGSDGKRQKGGDIIKPDEMVDFSNSQRFSVPEMVRYNNEFSCTNSLHHIMRSHKIIPKSISPQRFYSDLGLGPIPDEKVNDKLPLIAKKMVVENEVQDTKNPGKSRVTTMIDGVNIFIVERDCNDSYDVDLVKKENSAKISKSDLSVILMKEGQWYVPLYFKDDDDKKIGLFETSHPVIQKLLEEVE